jgi:hypothetical protein
MEIFSSSRIFATQIIYVKSRRFANGFSDLLYALKPLLKSDKKIALYE